MTSRWAPYRPSAGAAEIDPPPGLRIRRATGADCPTVAAIEADRDGADPTAAEARCRDGLGRPESLLLVADVSGTVVGFGRIVRFTPSAGDGSNVPAGWYLAGVIIVDAWRRRGIGLALTRERLAWIAERADAAYYVANARNLASLDMHSRLGFVESSRDVRMPGLSFEGGLGVLSRIDLGRETTLTGRAAPPVV